MHKKRVIVSRLPAPLPVGPAKRILLSRETIRTLTPEQLSQAVGGDQTCPCGSSEYSGSIA